MSLRFPVTLLVLASTFTVAGEPKDVVPTERYPATDEVETTLVAGKAEYEIGEPIEILIAYRNVGKGTYSVEEDHFGIFHSAFEVTDKDGRVLPNPYEDVRPFCLNGPVSKHVLKPGDKVRIWRTLNECVRFDRPGTYTVLAFGFVRLGTSTHSVENTRRPKAVPLALRIRDFDRGKRARDIEALVSAYRNKGRLPRGLPFEKQLYHVSSELRGSPFNRPERYMIVRLLAFFGEPSLIPFFLDVVESADWNGNAVNGLAAIRDRKAVLKAFEERLDQPEKYNSTKLLDWHLRLAVPDKGWKVKGAWKAREELGAKYRARAMKLLKGDKEYRYAYLVPRLLGRGEDLFLVDYALRSGPDREMLRQCSGAIKRVRLGREHIPFLEPMLEIRRDWSITDAAITQLVRLDREKYLPVLREDALAGERRFSPEAHRLLNDEPGGD